MDFKDALKEDLHPSHWLSKYKKTSYWYLGIMFGFYLGLGYLVSGIFTSIIETTFPDYKEPDVKAPLSGLLDAGPFEDSLFFGIPYYASGHPVVMLATGIIWSSLHMLNTETFDTTHLAYGNFFFAACFLFFSLRTWVSGLGWFSIIVHSAYDGSAFAAGCAIDNSCTLASRGDSLVIGLSMIFMFVAYYLYRRRKEIEIRRELRTTGYSTLQLFPKASVECSWCRTFNLEQSTYCTNCGQAIGANKRSVLGRMTKPSRRMAITVIIVSLITLFSVPYYISFPIIAAIMLYAVFKKQPESTAS